MKFQAITTIAIVTGLFASSAQAGGFGDFKKAVRTVRIVNNVLKGHPGPGPHPHPGPIVKPLPHPHPGPVIKPLPHPGPHPQPKPPLCKKPLPQPEIHPHPHPHPKPQPPICHKPKPQPPICEKPLPPGPPVCKKPICHPPQQQFSLKVHNRAGAEVYYSLNQGEYESLQDSDFNTHPAGGGKAPVIEYRYGEEIVQRELNPNGEYAFEWQGDVLVLVDLQS